MYQKGAGGGVDVLLPAFVYVGAVAFVNVAVDADAGSDAVANFPAVRMDRREGWHEDDGAGRVG